MKIPLTLQLNDRNKTLDICQNGVINSVDIPFAPFLYVRKDMFPEISANSIVQFKEVPSHNVHDYYKISFNSERDLHLFYKEAKQKHKDRYIWQQQYAEALYMLDSDYTLRYPNTAPLKVFYWDIETRTIGDHKFSKPHKDPILCAGYSIWLYNHDGTKRKVDYKLIHNYVDDDKIQDTHILQEIIDVISKNNIDVIAGYNSNFFDFPFLYARCKIQNVDMSPLGRNGREPYIKDDGKIYINGRIHYDMYTKVKVDQSLYGLKDKTLKTIARHYKVPLSLEKDIELKEDIENTYKVYKENHQKLLDYQEADVIRTEHVGHVYIRNDITLAEFTQVPLDSTMNSYSSFLPKLFMGRQLNKRQMISTETNFSKYNSINGSIYKFRKSPDKKELKYQGALVGLYKHGKFPMSWKLDFTSMYPSCIVTWNLGPDTTELVRVEPYTGKYQFGRDQKYNWFRVPDKNFGVDLIVKVKHYVDGFLKKEIIALWDERAIIKSEMNNLSEDENDRYAALYSQQLAIKVLLNSIYGMQGLKTSSLGEMIVGVMVTAMCRWTTTKTIQKYEDYLIELDTDGLAIDYRVSEEDTNKWLDKLMLDTFNITDNRMQMELDVVGPAYFCAMKNYVTEEGGKINIHGSSLKSSKFCNIQDRARDLAIAHWFYQKPIEEVLSEAYDFTNVDLKDFEFRVRVSMDIEDYVDQTTQIPCLALQYEEHTGDVAEEDTRLPFVYAKNRLPGKKYDKFYSGTKKKYQLMDTIKSIDEIDLSEYKIRVDKMLENFRITPQIDLFGHSEVPPPKVKLNKVPKD